IFDKVWEQIFFAYISDRVICGSQPSLVKKYIVYRHYNTLHCQEYSKYVDEEKQNLIEGLKLVHQEGRDLSVENIQSSTKALTASFAIAHLIAKNSKSYSEGEFVKECLIAA
ncbi:hypothetical protein EAI_03829, partial [Harpegnathos saltator]